MQTFTIKKGLIQLTINDGYYKQKYQYSSAIIKSDAYVGVMVVCILTFSIELKYLSFYSF